MRIVILVLTLLFLTSCFKTEEEVAPTSLQLSPENSDEVSRQHSGKADNFADLKEKKDGSCATEEELQKKFEDQLKQKQASPEKKINPLTGEPDCAVQ